MKKLYLLQAASLAVFALVILIGLLLGGGKTAFLYATVVVLAAILCTDVFFTKGVCKVTLAFFAAACFTVVLALGFSVPSNFWILAPQIVFLSGCYFFSKALASELALHKEDVAMSAALHGTLIYALFALWYPAVG